MQPSDQWAIIALAGTLALFVLGLRLSLTGKLQLHWSPVSAGLLALAAASLASTLVVSPNKVEALTQPLGFVSYISLFLLTLFGKPVLWWLLSASAAALATWQVIQLGTSPLLPLSANWSIFLETIKQPLHAVFGVGPENFLSAFSSGRPASLNMSMIWDTRFTAGSSFLFHTATTLGIAGVAALLPFFRIKNLFVLLILSLLLIMPPGLPVFVLAVSLLKTLSCVPARECLAKSFSIPAGSAMIMLSFLGLYLLSRVYLAEVSYGRAIAAMPSNDGNKIYNHLLTAVTHNPYRPSYHATLSQVSLSLAEAVKDRQLIIDFYQQAIREGKLAIKHAPTSPLMWENLTSVYKSFVGIATSADTWTIAAIGETIRLDPTNPLLRLQLGSLYLRTSRLDDAAAAFQSAIALKPNLANAHYNLAYVFKQKGEFFNAALSFRRTSELVSPGSVDADRVNADLAEAMAKLSSEESAAVSQAPITPRTPSTEEILSPVVDFSPIPTPKLSLPNFPN